MSERRRTNPAIEMPGRTQRRELLRQLQFEQEGKSIPGYAEYLAQIQALDEMMEGLSVRNEWGFSEPISQNDKEKLQEAIQNTAMAGEKYLQNVKDARKEGKKVSLTSGAPGVVRKLQGIISNDAYTIAQYDPSMELSLPQLLEMSRTKTLLLNKGEMETLGGNQNSRIPLTIENAEGKKYRGVFTKATYSKVGELVQGAVQEVVDQAETEEEKQVLGGLKEKMKDYFKATYPKLANIDENRMLISLIELHTSTNARGNRRMFNTRQLLSNLGIKDGIISDETISILGRKMLSVYDRTNERINAMDLKVADGARIDSRSSAMSAVSDLLGVPKVLARATNMRFMDGQGRIQEGTVMDFSKHLDLNDKLETYKQVSDHPFDGPESYKALKQMADLQALDYICGNVDRHGGNLMYEVNENGEIIGVQGIDNDSSFGNFAPGKEHYNRLPGTEEMNCMTKSMANTILKMDPAMLKFTLRGRNLSEKELDFAVKRLKDLKKAIQAGNEHYKNHPKVDENTENPIDKGFIRVLSDDEFKHLKMSQLTLEDQSNIFTEASDLVERRLFHARDNGLEFDPEARKAAKEKELKQMMTQDSLYTGQNLYNSIKGAGKLVQNGDFDIDKLTSSRMRTSPEFDQMVSEAKRLSELEENLKKEMDSRQEKGHIHFSAVEYDRLQQPIAEAKEHLKTATMIYLEKKMRERKATSIETLVGKNNYEKNRINHAKAILEFTNSHEVAPAIPREPADAKEGEALEIRLGSDLSAEEEAKAAMKMLREIHKQHNLDAPEEMRGMDGETFNEILEEAAKPQELGPEV